jgi:glutathione S-transferase
MRSLWLLYELGIDFKLTAMPFDLSVLRAPDYLSIHPLGRVPALVDGEVTIFESGAIAQYLCERYDFSDPTKQLGRPPGHPERGAWLQWLHYAETMAVHGASLVQQTVFIAPADRSPVVAKLEGRRLEKSLEVIDRQLADQDFLLESGFSAVDTAVGYSVHLATRFMALDAFSHVLAYYKRISERPAFIRAASG